MSTMSTTERGQDLVIERTISATPSRVWKAWTDAAALVQWWGPKGFTCPVYHMDLKVGGKYLYCMKSPDGQEYWGAGEYREILPNRRLVFSDNFADSNGKIVPASFYGMTADYPPNMLVMVTFEENGNLTKMTVHHVGIPAGEERENARLGWIQSFDKLDNLLKRSK